MFMAQEPDLGVNAAPGRKAAKGPGTQNPVAGDQDGNRVGTAGLSHRLRRGCDRTGDVAIGQGLSKRDVCHGAADLVVQAGAKVERQVEAGQTPVETGLQLGQSLDLEGRRLTVRRVPIQTSDPPGPFPSLTGGRAG